MSAERTHLVGVFDPVAKQLSLYVNGQFQSSGAHATAWNATGPVQIGRSLYNGAYGSYWPGGVDDVRIHDRAVSADEARDLFTAHPTVAGRWKLNAASGTPATSPDDSLRARPVTLGGTARIEQVSDGVGIATARPGVRLDGGP